MAQDPRGTASAALQVEDPGGGGDTGDTGGGTGGGGTGGTTQPPPAFAFLTSTVYYDNGDQPNYSTRCNNGYTPFVPNYHCCQPGYVMTGVSVNDNMFRCTFVNAQPWYYNRVADNANGTHRNGMHVCPPNYFMVGMSAQDNVLICQPGIPGTVIESVDANGATRDTGKNLHMCPLGTAMTGINVNKNDFSCGRY
ncbi:MULTISPECIES: hypothetical protein [Corallococcus]|uniref:hypothetical protein n=1 Tax=Corallococcus TaxID=83461 RepID=UPI00117F07ED|nr:MULTISPECIES: hypothetical protein [Corallococcus]NBD07956.1 hypothetical protein [Corallococcus silvisoli]TSC33944.1 hypothetical protein FOF48_02540 [Corallococcus sp. Z5C101001]